MDIYQILLDNTSTLLKSQNKRAYVVKMGEICKDLENELKCPTNPFLKDTLKSELAGQLSDYSEDMKKILLYYKPYLSVHKIISNIYEKVIKNVDHKDEMQVIIESLMKVESESITRSKIAELEKSSETLDHLLNTQLTDLLSRKTQINPYQLRYIVSQYKQRKLDTDNIASIIDEQIEDYEEIINRLKKEKEVLIIDRHKNHIDRLIKMYQKSSVQRLETISLDQEILGEPVSANLIDPHAQPTPKLIQRFSFSIPDISDQESIFTDVMDELQIVHAANSVPIQLPERKHSINQLEQYLKFRKSDMSQIPEQDLHLELVEKSKSRTSL
eukprot:NODE_59_length_28102_cov_0.971110.p12 type:complete len:329 gc:universal NODE_59_length_28102_cov_0.971110:16492-17478(+)